MISAFRVRPAADADCVISKEFNSGFLNHVPKIGSNIRYFLKSKVFNVRMFISIQMFECSLIFFSDPCSRVRMFGKHERILNTYVRSSVAPDKH